MYAGTTLFTQVMDFLPWKAFHRLVARHEGNRGVRALSCDEQCRVLAFAQLTGRESLRDIEASLSPQSAKLHRIGICVRVILSGWSGDEIASSSGADYYSMLLRGGRWR